MELKATKLWIQAAFLLAMSSALLLTACGGGGGGGGGGTPSSPTAVTLAPLPIGSANAAGVTSEVIGAQDLSSAAGGGGIFGAAVVPASSAQLSLSDLARSQLTTILGLPLNTTVTVTGAVQVQTEPCDSGSITVQWNDADENSQLSAGDTVQLTFNTCASEGATLDGVTTIQVQSITGDPISAPTSPWSLSASTSFQSLTLTEGSEVWTVHGGMTVNLQFDGVSLYTTSLTGSELTVTEPAGAWTLRDFQYDETDDDASGAYTWAQTGRLDSDIIGGQVTFETTTTFEGVGTAYPNTGVLVIRGSNNASVKMQALSDATNVDLDVDSNGDSVVDVTVPTTWAALGA